MSRETFDFQTAAESVKMRPSAEASGMVLRHRKKLLDWQGSPMELSIMWKRKESSQQMQFSLEQLWLRIRIRSFSV